MHEIKINKKHLLFSLLVLLSACDAKDANSQKYRSSSGGMPLTLYGYNYTNRYIDNFSVNGQGGGNLYVSKFNAGGGGGVCCVRYFPGAGAWEITVRWQVSACIYDEGKDSDGLIHLATHYFYKDEKVLLEETVSVHPAYLEVHFYPDGHVEAEISENMSNSRLQLSEKREDKSDYPRCPGGAEPSA